ncbi:MAG: Demethylmenaquinone methyltransferase [Chlamydiae bacterium]|nr:Demethylmenaquinone methyltransferase [Chlamydiota bacterium]
MRERISDTSWEGVGKWYEGCVGKEGHYYHKQVIFPKLLPLLGLQEGNSLLDLACGEGIFSRVMPKGVSYQGIDLSPALVQAAKAKAKRGVKFTVGDICSPLPFPKDAFTHAVCILALQNVAHPEKTLEHAASLLVPGGTLVLVLNHPCFRIPRQSSWGVDEEKKIQYRRIDRYLSPLKIPIEMAPGKGKKSPSTWSFHHSLSDYSQMLKKGGFLIEEIEEWTSDKKSTGKNARMENRSRSEFPLFLTLKARKASR